MEKLKSQTGIPIDNVLLATDFSPITEVGLSYAAAIADRYHSKLYVAHVINMESFDLLESESARVLIQQARDEANRKITKLLDPLRLAPDGYQIVVAEGSIADLLVDIIQKNEIDLAVLGTHGRRAFKKLFMGSVAEEVFRMAPCPVLMVGPKTKPVPAKDGPRHILYTVEFAPDTSNAARYAVSLAERYSATLTVMNVREDISVDPNFAAQVSQPYERWVRENVPAESDLRGRLRFERGFGPVTNSILNYAAKSDVDMIVMSVSQLDPVMAAHLPNSGTAYELVSRALCPVLTVR
jgi:nucleotide-binding universal stress UspA family protein